MNSETYIKNFIEVLDLEVKYKKKGHGATVIQLIKGEYLGEIVNKHIYEFLLDSDFIPTQDIPAKIEIKNEEFDCDVILVEKNKIRITTEITIGSTKNIEGKLKTSLWYIPEALKKKYEKALISNVSDFELPTNVLNDNQDFFIKKINEPRYSFEKNKSPNNSQKDAIKRSFQNGFSIIWGPPGTGKTNTISKLIEAFLKDNKKILLVSHANAAVDNALYEIAMHLKDTEYRKKGEIIRLGMPTWDKMELEECGDLILENVIDAKAEYLSIEKNILLKKEKNEKEEIDKYEIYLEKNKKIIEMENSLKEKNKELKLIKKNISTTKETLFELLSKKKEKEEWIEKNLRANVLKKLIIGFNLEKKKSEIVKLQIFINENEELKNNLEQQLNKLTKENEEIEKNIEIEKDFLFDYHNKINVQQQDLNKYLEKKKQIIKEIKKQIIEIDKKIEGIKGNIVKDARLIGTTMTKTFLSSDIAEDSFDVVIVDEVSMASVPSLYWAMSKAKQNIILVGDFMQLPPINSIEEELAKKWLGHSIFDILSINDDLSYEQLKRKVNLLDEQYRMNPEIAKIASDYFYKGLLKSHPNTKNKVTNEKYSGENPLVLINTSKIGATVSQPKDGTGKINFYHALICAHLSKQILEENPKENIGIVTQYKEQAKLIAKMLEDLKLNETIRVDTVHKYQGGENDVMIFDLVESKGYGSNWSKLDDNTNIGEDAKMLINVAITRSKNKLFLICNKDFIDRKFSKNSILPKILNKIEEKYPFIDPQLYLKDITFADDDSVILNTNLFNEIRFWDKFKEDIDNVEESLIIMSPFITMRRLEKLLPTFKEILLRGGKIKIFTKPPKEEKEKMKDNKKEAIEVFKKMNIEVLYKEEMHQKVAIIDNKISWEGSLNILSHNNTNEQMRRFFSKEIVNEMVKYVTVEMSLFVKENELSVECDVCNKGTLIKKTGKYGIFYTCKSCGNSVNQKNIKKIKNKEVESSTNQTKNGENDSLIIDNSFSLKKKLNLDNQINNDIELLNFLKSNGIEIVDKRNKNGGNLWVVGGKELQQMFNNLKRKGYNFKFSEKGGKATKNRSGWFYRGK